MEWGRDGIYPAAMATRPTTTCPRCSTTFEAARGKGPGGLYCTWACARAESQRLAGGTGRACLWCTGPIPAALDARAIYCSQHCGVSAGNQRRRARPALTEAGRIADLEGRDAMAVMSPRFGRLVVSVPDWPDAACRRSSWLPDIWADPAGEQELEAARAVCGTCPRLAECREFGTEHVSVLRGVWGGLTHYERTRLRRERQKAGAA